MIFNPFDASFYQSTRTKLARALPPASIAILHSNDKMPCSGDQFFPFRQHKDLLKLCGIYQEETALVLFPDHPELEKREILFIRKTNDHHKTWEGDTLQKEDAKRISGVSQIYWFDQFETIVFPMVTRAEKIYLNSNEKGQYPQLIQSRDVRYGEKLKRQFPWHDYCRLQPILRQLALIKTKEEIHAIKQAVKLTGDTWNSISAATKPGMYEYEIAALITYEFERQGAIHAFEPIVASGASACVLHYKTNHHKLIKNDLLLVDFGAEWNGYAADMTRCKAVDGTMTSRQFMIYDQVLHLYQIARSMMKPGGTIAAINDELLAYTADALLQLGVIKKVDLDDNKDIVKKFLPHGVAHFLGMDVHDYGDRYIPLAPGMIITCEPGIYIHDDGIGIRLENDILITKDGHEDLMANYEL